MVVEIISTGTELLLGEIVDTNAAYLSVRLNELGYDVLYRTTVGDNAKRMQEAFKVAFSRADIIITSGGLGPTKGDITKEVAAEFCGRKMILDEPSLERMQAYFDKRNICMSPNNTKQAIFAENAVILDNPYGTAPGMLLEHESRVLINLPGPPRELKGVFEDTVVPYLQDKYGNLGTIYSYTLRSIGLGESKIAELLDDLITVQDNPTIALYAREAEILIRITAKAESKDVAQELLRPVAQLIRARLGDYIYGDTEQNLQTVLGNMLLEQRLTIALAESCTGGLLSSMLVDVPGSSAYLKGAVVTYSNESKIRDIGVCAADLATHGAVSRTVAEQMACGVRKLMNSDIGIGITGIAGPGGGTAQKPVGLVYIAVDLKGQVACREYLLNGSRAVIRLRTAKAAIAELMDIMKNSL